MIEEGQQLYNQFKVEEHLANSKAYMKPKVDVQKLINKVDVKI